ncbi:MAG: heparan-alpha-glucosaminide N-acetyltransferase domain-containing protein [Actinomycetales bacterium]
MYPSDADENPGTPGSGQPADLNRAPATPAATASAHTDPSRILGIDLARGIALVAMMAAHIVTRSPGAADAVHAMVDGRAAATFAVLAGVSVTLVTGRRTPGRWAPAARALLARAGVIAAIGLTLGLFAEHIAVVLVNYGLLFAIAALLVPLRAPALTGLAAGWIVIAPQVSFALRRFPLPGDSPGPVTSWFDLAHPVAALTQLTLTGYYPVLVWTAYLLIGMAIGRSRLLTGSGALLVFGGALTWTVCFVGARAADAAWGISARLTVPADHPSVVVGGSVHSFYGTAPTNTWWWQLTDLRHSGTSLDLLATSAAAVTVLGACLLVTRVAVLRTATWPLQVVGSMPLTLYTVHVFVESIRTQLWPEPSGAVSVRIWVIEVAVLTVGACLYRVGARLLGASGRGPLEQLTREVSLAARDPGTSR